MPMKKFDVIIILIACLICIAAFKVSTLIGKDEAHPVRVEIYALGELYKTVYLTDVAQQIDIQTPHGHNILIVYPYGVKMLAADCPSQVCVHTPMQFSPGDTIACLPHKVLVKIVGI